jgi:uncharacterized protein (TIGR03435 family)
MKQGMARTFLATALVAASSMAATAQSALPVPAWQTAAGGSMAFEVATIRPSEPGTFHSPNFALSADDSYGRPGGVFSADFPLSVYIQFAYKLTLSSNQRKAMLAQLPVWARTAKFTIHAKAEGDPTKDQMRLMVQSLLKDRFKFTAHMEMQEMPVFTTQLIRTGKPGPNLIPHDQGPPCVAYSNSGEALRGASGEVFPSICDIFSAHETTDHMFEAGSRNAPLDLIANMLSSIGGLDQTVIDQTGLQGRYDFRIKFSPEPSSPAPPPGLPPTDQQGPSFLQALHEQLGLKLQATKATLPTLVIDHIEEPLPN